MVERFGNNGYSWFPVAVMVTRPLFVRSMLFCEPVSVLMTRCPSAVFVKSTMESLMETDEPVPFTNTGDSRVRMFTVLSLMVKFFSLPLPYMQSPLLFAPSGRLMVTSEWFLIVMFSLLLAHLVRMPLENLPEIFTIALSSVTGPLPEKMPEPPSPEVCTKVTFPLMMFWPDSVI